MRGAISSVMRSGNELGRAHTGQRNLSEATVDLGEYFGIGLVGEMIGSAILSAWKSVVHRPASAAAPEIALELPVDDES